MDMLRNSTKKESAALFVFGMGLHSLQDQQAHGNLTNARDHIPYNDDINYDYNEWILSK